MRRVALALALTAAGLVLLLSYKTPGLSRLSTDTAAGVDQPLAPGVGAGAGTSAGTGAGTRAGQAARAVPRGTGSGTGSGGGRAAPAGSRVVTGPVVNQPYGPVQVQVAVTGRRITRIAAVRLPTSSAHSAEINSGAVPTLRQEALAAQSARIDTVSGATYTSDAYRRSLQAALDAARR